jgi:hypothetical protein
MKKILTGTALVAALSLAGLTAHASCADPRAAQEGTIQEMAPLNLHQGPTTSRSDHDAAQDIVGTWHVTYTSGGAYFAQAFIQWHRDGTEWENINRPTLGGNICMGSWKSLDRSHVFRNHYGWLFTNGVVTGYFNETETDVVAWDGNSYIGTNSTKIYDLSGNLQVEVPGTASATRIEP